MKADLSRYWTKLRSIAILDPAIATRNAGDEIISQAARFELSQLLPDHFQTTLPTHERMGVRSWRLVQQSDYTIVAGSNILTTKLLLDRGWRYSVADAVVVNDIISLATGWRSYHAERAPLGRLLLKRALSDRAVHSVRDDYTRQRLADIGVRNVVNTGCVTMWRLDLDRLAGLPLKQAGAVITAVNRGRPSPHDQELADEFVAAYEHVYVWPQGIEDGPYVRKLFGNRATIIGPTLEAYDAVLRSDQPVDFVGTRLHAGIRAMQHGRRALIAAVDNRAAEIAKDTGLPIFLRNSGSLTEAIRSPKPIELTLPMSAIAEWRAQFGEAAR